MGSSLGFVASGARCLDPRRCHGRRGRRRCRYDADAILDFVVVTAFEIWWICFPRISQIADVLGEVVWFLLLFLLFARVERARRLRIGSLCSASQQVETFTA